MWVKSLDPPGRLGILTATWTTQTDRARAVAYVAFRHPFPPSQRRSSHEKGLRIPASEFFTPFATDEKFGYRRDTLSTPEHFIRAYRLRDKTTGKDGPWLAGLTLEPSVVYEAWWSQRPGGIIVAILEMHGKPTKAGESFSAAHIVGYFNTIEEMHAVYDHYKGHTALSVDESGWRLVK